MKIEEIVEEKYSILNDNDKYIWKFILNHKDECQKISIKELAKKCNVSHTTILRFAHKLGFEGYSEMKIHLKWDKIGDENSFSESKIKGVCDDVQAIMKKIQEEDFDDMFEIIKKAGKIYVTGTGDFQKNAARELQRNMLYAGKLIYTVQGEDEKNFILNYLNDNDIFILISFSGNNESFNQFAYKLKKRGIKTISFTVLSSSELSIITDFNISLYTHKILLSKDSRQFYPLSQIFIIFDIIMLKYVSYIQKNNTEY